MTDLDTLRRALRASPEPERAFAPAFDPAEIIARGRRLRWRRRAVAAGSGVCLAAAVFGAVAGVGRLTAPSSGPSHRTVIPIGPAGARPRQAPSPTRGDATPSASPSATARPTPSATATPVRALPSTPPTPTSTSTAPGSAPSASPTSPAVATTSPSAGATGASGNQPSPTPTATQ
jgi:hypothetical protein